MECFVEAFAQPSKYKYLQVRELMRLEGVIDVKTRFTAARGYKTFGNIPLPQDADLVCAPLQSRTPDCTKTCGCWSEKHAHSERSVRAVVTIKLESDVHYAMQLCLQH